MFWTAVTQHFGCLEPILGFGIFTDESKQVCLIKEAYKMGKFWGYSKNSVEYH